MDAANNLMEPPAGETRPKPNSISDIVNQLGLFSAHAGQTDLENKLNRALKMFDLTKNAGAVELAKESDETFRLLITDPGKRCIELNKTFGMQTIKSIDLDAEMSLFATANESSVRLFELQGAQIKAIFLGQNVSLNLKTIILEPDGDGWTKIKLQVSLPATPNHLLDFTIPQKRSK